MAKPPVIFRTNASPLVGYGHLVRCRALAESLRKHGTDCIMVGPKKSEQTDQDAGLFDLWIEESYWESESEDVRKLVALAKKHG
ncbi:MAG: hypothetical protein AVO38_15740 [delta proteobacterium ML8_D]|jgi:UDP-2,4-diacetamido-2,4,6-trideoxy-beta-L-altropyranose hydrolase|nr:MAG: hypothetical protein AVO38_15740 [delta proteobacterium ML8_D]